MKLIRHRLLAVLAAAAMLTATVGCSQDSSSNAAQNSNAEQSSTASDESSTTDPANSKGDDDISQSQSDSQPSDSENSSGGDESSIGGDQPDSKPDVTTTATSATNPPVSSSTSVSSGEGTAPREEKYIYLKNNTAQYSGTGIMVDGNTVTITKGGIYVLSGTLNGSVQVLTEDKKVYLELNNAHIHNAEGAALNVQQAKRISITTLKGTTNSFTDGGVHEETRGAIFSNDTVELNGEGVLNITANYAHGIRSDDDIILNSGTVNITSVKSGFHCNDGIEINGGKLFCDAGTNGVKTLGYITITGGESVFIGGTREEKGAIYCDGTFTYSGGTFYAIGNLCALPSAATSTAHAVAIEFTNLFGPNRAVNVKANGKDVLSITSPNNFRYVMFGGTGLTTTGTYSVSAGGTLTGSVNHYLAAPGAYQNGNAYVDFASNGIVTKATIPS